VLGVEQAETRLIREFHLLQKQAALLQVYTGMGCPPHEVGQSPRQPSPGEAKILSPLGREARNGQSGNSHIHSATPKKQTSLSKGGKFTCLDETSRIVAE
jgi:hypothetical protein